jgi:hypothetical protein
MIPTQGGVPPTTDNENVSLVIIPWVWTTKDHNGSFDQGCRKNPAGAWRKSLSSAKKGRERGAVPRS